MITVKTNVQAPVEKVWEYFTIPNHITKWYNASDDWHAPYAENDLKVGGKFKTNMAARDGSSAFDFEGEYTKVEDCKAIDYSMADGRIVNISFENSGQETLITESFDPEEVNSLELQEAGWQAILNNFKNYVESN